MFDDPSHLQIVFAGKTLVDLHGWKAVAAVLPFAGSMLWLAYHIAFSR